EPQRPGRPQRAETTKTTKTTKSKDYKKYDDGKSQNDVSAVSFSTLCDLCGLCGSLACPLCGSKKASCSCVIAFGTSASRRTNVMLRRDAACETSRSGMRSSAVTARTKSVGSARRFS